MISLMGRTALVTGSSRGIGRACALRLAEAGADVILNYVTSYGAANEVAETIRNLGRRVAIIKADMSEEDDIASMCDFVKDSFGSLDILVSNAATGGFRPLVATTAKHFDIAMNTNVRAFLFLVQGCLPLLKKCQGNAKVIGLSSHGSFRALPMYGIVGSTKAAMESMARHLALEIGMYGINVNIVQAGLVRTDSSSQIYENEELVDAWRKKCLLGDRTLDVNHVADVVLYLASPLSDMIQGQSIVVDAGASITI